MVGFAAASDALRRGKSSFLVFLLITLSGPVGLINRILFRPETLEKTGWD
ncbi:hypothetical protein [Alkaliphilus peptidifermentans]|uniref:Uncharacterized protein n=1 Tax=Alkaliphilus peptidifermentans DSM 18978 TaxID=1120976 RepID=A0A1G5ITH6_9FIRM|nr:hypothetical protein [Alkaliphilus peptidifermentans]SCY79393.1 hypothetical protein SAMN03080606_02513 [Alkaliphilus peptidifermentans DSM 18978]